MSDTDSTLSKHAQRRRDFLNNASAAEAVAPALVLLLGAGLKPPHTAAYALPHPDLFFLPQAPLMT